MSISIAIRDWFTRSLSNEQLMTRYAKLRQRQVLAQLYENCGSDLYHFLLTLSDPTTAEDIAQQVWVKIIEKRHLYTSSGQFKSWLFTIGRRMLIDELRKQQRFVTDEYDDAVHASTDRAAPNELDNDLARFNDAVNALPFEQREAFCLQQEGFSLAEIGEITHVQHETVKSRLRYAKQKLNQVMTHDEQRGER